MLQQQQSCLLTLCITFSQSGAAVLASAPFKVQTHLFKQTQFMWCHWLAYCTTVVLTQICISNYCRTPTLGLIPWQRKVKDILISNWKSFTSTVHSNRFWVFWNMNELMYQCVRVMALCYQWPQGKQAQGSYQLKPLQPFGHKPAMKDKSVPSPASFAESTRNG